MENNTFAKLNLCVFNNMDGVATYYVAYIGMLSKSRGHILRLAVVFHVSFHLGKDGPVSSYNCCNMEV